MDGTLGDPLRGQDIRHPDGQYGTLAKWFHWLTVPLMAVALSTGPTIRFIKDEPKMAFYAVHESAGLLILALALSRLLFRRFSPPPALPAHIPAAMRRAAAGVHHALYAALVIQPVLGFLTTNAYGFPLRGETAYLGFIDLPKFMDTNEPLANALLAAHGWLGLGIVVLLVVHVGAVVFHQAIRKDDTLLRMV